MTTEVIVICFLAIFITSSIIHIIDLFLFKSIRNQYIEMTKDAEKEIAKAWREIDERNLKYEIKVKYETEANKEGGE